jgi:RNA polymerase sigma factor for flagellar operon FliA
MSYLPRSAVAINKSHSQASNELATRLGREPTRGELAEFMGMDTEDLQKERGDALRFETESIEDMAEEVGNIAGDEGMRPDLIAENTQFMQALEQAIENLPEREKLIIALYYVEELNLREIAEVMGVSVGRVSQLKTEAAQQIHRKLSKDFALN